MSVLFPFVLAFGVACFVLSPVLPAIDVPLQREARNLSEELGDGPSISALVIISAPRPFIGRHGSIQKVAITSWLNLHPNVSVYLLGNHPTFYVIAAEINNAIAAHSTGTDSKSVSERVRVNASIDFNYNGIPLVNSIIRFALEHASTDSDSYTAIIDASCILLLGFLPAIRFVSKSHERFFIVASHSHLRNPFPLPSEVNVTQLLDRKSNLLTALAEAKDGWLKHSADVSLWLWRNSPTPFMNMSRSLPFLYKRGSHDRWLASEVTAFGSHTLIDISDVDVAIHVQEAPDVDNSNDPTDTDGSLPRVHRWETGSAMAEEVELNKWLLETNRVNYNSPSLLASLTWTSTEQGRKLCLTVLQCLDNEQTGSHGWICKLSSESRLPAREQPSLPLRGPETVLPLLKSKVLTMVAVSGNYKDMLMNFVCTLRRLGLPTPLVAAMDLEVYNYASEQGLAVFYDNSVNVNSNQSRVRCDFGTTCFKKLTKLKSRLVLTVLKMGYSVLFSDVDIVWFRDPYPEILAYPAGTLVVQSDRPWASEPSNGGSWKWAGGSINSGFYFARSERRVEEALQEVVMDAMHSNTSEQPSFHKVLCGNGKFIVGREECLWPRNGLRVIFLPRTLHPNGHFNDYWKANDTRKACVEGGCATLHNNWILGKGAKVERLKKKGFWFYNRFSRTCRYI